MLPSFRRTRLSITGVVAFADTRVLLKVVNLPPEVIHLGVPLLYIEEQVFDNHARFCWDLAVPGVRSVDVCST